mmetsp:Transcript_23683/g.76140  ORF Transcript_23683/g.76140 Transcript_23683/m.76140 type:complete len:275 (+) Transcript_23683:349-1173(+)
MFCRSRTHGTSGSDMTLESTCRITRRRSTGSCLLRLMFARRSYSSFRDEGRVRHSFPRRRPMSENEMPGTSSHSCGRRSSAKAVYGTMSLTRFKATASMASHTSRHSMSGQAKVETCICRLASRTRSTPRGAARFDRRLAARGVPIASSSTARSARLAFAPLPRSPLPPALDWLRRSSLSCEPREPSLDDGTWPVPPDSSPSAAPSAWSATRFKYSSCTRKCMVAHCALMTSFRSSWWSRGVSSVRMRSRHSFANIWNANTEGEGGAARAAAAD